ncbi:MAG: hypothetical protein M9890_09715 [Thermomicrobiales bacterium]|nr:hypothetical protein [Thermomicrobiales bacterium]
MATGSASETTRYNIEEAFRTLRSTVKFASGERRIQSVLVVDVDTTKTSDVARHLAESFVQAGDRCAYVETDGRSGASAAGFADLIAGKPLPEKLLQAGSAGLVIVPAGQAAGGDHLASAGTDSALSALSDQFDLIVLSCAPLPRFADALALASRVDGVIMVVASGTTRRPKAIDARDALQRVGANILGVVLVEGKRGLFSR